MIPPAWISICQNYCSDPVKSGFHTEALRERPLEYWQLYLRLGEGEYQNISEGVRTDAVRSLGHYPNMGNTVTCCTRIHSRRTTSAISSGAVS